MNSTTTGQGNVFRRFADQKAVRLTTYKRDGTPVGTAVNIAVEGDHAYVRTWDTAWKLKRIRRNPIVEVAPSTMRGTPTGPAVRAKARVLEGAESAHARSLLERKHRLLQGILVPLGHRLRHLKTVHIELTLIET